MDELVEHFVDRVLSVQYIVCVLIFAVLLGRHRRLLVRVLALHAGGGIAASILLLGGVGIVEEVGHLFISLIHPWLVGVYTLLGRRHRLSWLALHPTREYYTLRRVLDKHPFRLDPVLRVGLFQRRLATLQVGLGHRARLRCGCGRWTAARRQEG